MAIKKQKNIEQKTYLKIIKKNLADIKSTDKVILGVSGGVDSVFLLDSLVKIFLKQQIIVAHVNHSLREEADFDEQFVKNLCQQYGVKLFVKKINIKKIASEKKTSIEGCGRNERYLFFRELKNKTNAKYILTAHHKDDLAESILLNFSRGSFIRGLIGIKKTDFDLLRPLLDFSKEEIIALSKKLNLAWVLDKTNLDTKFRRNYIRHEFLGPIKKLNPAILDRFTKFSRNMEALDIYLKSQISNFLTKNSTDFLIAEFEDFPEILKKEILVSYYEKFNLKRENITDDFLEEICRFIKTAKNNTYHQFTQNIIISKKNKQIFFREAMKSKASYIEEIKITPPATIEFHGQKIIIEEISNSVDLKLKNCYFFYLDADLVGRELLIRSWRSGDRFKPFGLGHSKKIQDFFVDLKIDRLEREKIPIFVNSNGVIMAVGNLRVSDDFCIKKKTKNIIKISIN